MQNAPSTRFPVGRSALHGACLMLLGAGVLLLCGLWWWGVLPGLPVAGHWRPAHTAGWVAWPMAALWSLWAWRSWRCPPLGQLQWDAVSEPPLKGAALELAAPPAAGLWRWHSPAHRDGLVLLAVVCVWDLQRLVLLRLDQPDGPSRWVWLERRQSALAWAPLRRALHAHAG